jgi:hypothetical protein
MQSGQTPLQKFDALRIGNHADVLDLEDATRTPIVLAAKARVSERLLSSIIAFVSTDQIDFALLVPAVFCISARKRAVNCQDCD